ncbi:MAG: hypothetical protein Q9184_000965 [Pyrenodesmia sp. 2 TL-2023]
MARLTSHLNLSSIYPWHEADGKEPLVYNLRTEAIQNGTIDPYILAATTVLHLLVSASRRLLNTDISALEYLVLLLCIIAASVEEVFDCKKPESTLDNLTHLAAKPGVQSTLILSKSDGSIIKSTGVLATTAKPASLEASVSGLNLGDSYSPAATPNDRKGLGKHDRATDRDKSAEHIAKIVFKILGAGNELADEMEAGDDTKLLRIRTLKNEIMIVPGQ